MLYNNITRLLMGLTVLGAAVLLANRPMEPAHPGAIAATADVKKGAGNMEIATFGAGCFWGEEASFRQVKGVVDTAVGFMGGTWKNPSYKDVCRGDTGHAEVCQVKFDPAVVTYDQLLDVFWSSHDPTTLDRQGPDVGQQYRSVIFYHTPAQQAAAEASKKKQGTSGAFHAPIVTQVVPAGTFYQAEEYHQRYLEKNGLAVCGKH